VATGDELVPADNRPGPNEIRDSNGHALLAQTLAAGATGDYRGPVPDDRAALAQAITAALAADVVLVTGGVSVGEKDFVPAILEELGVERLFHRWDVKPGGPLWFGRRGDTLVFGLPGNPAAAFVGFEILVAPVLAVRLGRPFAPRATILARPTAPLPAPSSRRQFTPVTLDLSVAPAAATPVRWSGSGDPFGLAKAHGLAIVPETGRASDVPPGFARVVPTLAGGLGDAS
jgi:molybdopterin molybdotransferase